MSAPVGLHAVVLAVDFPPIDSSLSRRTLAIANALADRVAAVTVVTVDSAASRNDHGEVPALAAAVDPRVRVVRVPDDHPDLVQDIAAWPRERAADPAGWRAQWLHDAATQFDEPGAGHLWDPLLAEAGRVRAEAGVDLVVAVGPPALFIAAGAELSRTWGCDLVVDLARVSAEDLTVEPERVGAALAQARALTVPDDATRRRLNGQLAARAVVVPDGGEVTVETPPRREAKPGSPLRVACFVEADAWGSFVEVLEGWFETSARAAEFAEARLTVHGRFPLVGAAAVRLAAAQAAERGVVVDATGDGPEAGSGADVLLVVSRGDLPAGRTRDHLLAGRPIVWCTAQEPDADHALERATHVVRAASLSARDIRTAMEAARQIDAVPDPTPTRSSWPLFVSTLLDERIDGSAR